MADEVDPNASESESAGSRERRSTPRRQPLTPEQRKFLGPGRSWHDREAAKQEPAQQPEPPAKSQEYMAPSDTQMQPASEWSPPAEPTPPQTKPERPRTPPPAAAMMPDQKISRALEMQTVALVIGGLILLGATFYAGTKARSLKAFFGSKGKSQVANIDVKKFPGLSAEELVEQALADERLGNWRGAIERLLVAKRRNVLYRGLYFHAGKLAYDHHDFDAADLILDRAAAFGEQPDTALFLRGQIATGRNDLPAAEQLFQAAIDAEPFTPGYYYFLGEVLRRDHRQKDAIIRYEQGANRTINEQDATLCRFKARMAKAETADRGQLEVEVEKKRNGGPLSVDWLLTDAALKLLSGEIEAATQLIQEAKANASPLPTLFALCTSDMLFVEAATKHPEIADACRVSGGPAASSATPKPFASP